MDKDRVSDTTEGELGTHEVPFPKNKETVEFQISDDTDLNNEEGSLSQKWDGTEKLTSKCFSEEIYAFLPVMLKDPIRFLLDDNEKEVFLVGALGVISGLLPNVTAHYRGAIIESNLYAYLIAPYGEGKSSLEYARRLAMPVHRQLKEQARQLTKDFDLAMSRYSKDLKLYEKDGTGAFPMKPAKPAILKHFLASNTSKTGVLQLLYENDGRGTFFETEGDTIADTLRQDYGNFSDLLRNAYHHQGVSYFRRGNQEDVEIEFPRLSVVISSTFNQLVNLIPNAQNGLFSRFLYYLVKANPVFEDVFNSRKNEYNDFFDRTGEKYLELYNKLKSQSTPIYFQLQAHQQEEFVKMFQGVKDDLKDNVCNSLGGTVNRLGIMCFRIAMILSTLREFESGEIPQQITCQDVDFKNAVRIIKTLKNHMMAVYWQLHKPNELAAKEEKPDSTEEDQKRQCKQLYLERINAGYPPRYRDIALHVLGSKTRHQTVYRWIHG